VAFGDHAYTRIVRGLKVGLPLVIDPTAAEALSDQAFRDRIDSQQLSRPKYAGNTNSGKALTVTAQSARPDPDVEGKTYGQEVNAVIQLDNGEAMTVTSNTGIMNEGDDLAILSGNVHIVTTDGYDMRTSQLTSRISKIQGESAGPVTGFGPPGTLTAGKMAYKTRKSSGKVLLVFTDGVHLVYTKANDQEQ